MTVLEKDSFTLNLGIIKLTGNLSDIDRQCAWELYTEISTRVAMIGKTNDVDCKSFDGELLIESLQSLYDFFKESRKIMKKFPVGKLNYNKENHLGILINNIISNVLRPFLEKWQILYRYYWESESNPRLNPFDRQNEFPDIIKFLEDWSYVRCLMRNVQKKLIDVYELTV